MKKLGFGCMRMPLMDGEVDLAYFSRMIDTFLSRGFNYFDTAHGYISKKSEPAIRECLVKRHPREAYILTDKLSSPFFQTQADIRPFFEMQLENCGVDYFDYYLMHSQNAENFAKFKACRAYETALELKAEGKFKHFGISFHDKAAVLEQILTEYPEIEVVQIQFNYIDYEDVSVESRKCYEVCRKFSKPVIVMEPVKGGHLATLPEGGAELLSGFGSGSPASYAIRFAASFDGVMMVLSGMSDMEQVYENTSFMSDFKPLSAAEFEAVGKICELIRAQDLISCTACRYCTDGCPKQIPIPDLFACMNARKRYGDWNSEFYYSDVHTFSGGKASDCIGCGKCEKVCPQHLEIRKLLANVAAEFEKNEA